MPTHVDVVPSAAHLDERLLRALDAGTAAALAPTSITIDDLLRALHTRLLAALRLAPPALERLIVADALRIARARAEGPLELHGGALDGVARALEALRRHLLTADDLVRALDAVPADDAPSRARLRLLADVLRETDARLARAGLLAPSALDAQLAIALDALPLDAALPAPLGDASGCVLRARAVSALDPARVALFAALARALGRRGGRVDLHVACEPRRERTPAGLDRALRAIEALEDTPLELSLGLRDDDAPAAQHGLSDLLDALSTGGRARDVPVVLAEADGPDEEARWVATQVERWLAEGFAPHEIALVVREPRPDVLGPLGRALDAARVPWRDECGVPLASVALARAIVALPALVARGAPRDEVMHALAVIAGHAANRAADRPSPHRVTHALRRLRIESLFDTALDGRLREAERRGITDEVVRELLALRDGLLELLDDATVAEHATRLARFLGKTGGAERYAAEAQAVMASASYDPGAQTILRAIARDESALRAMLALLRELPALAARSGVAAEGQSVTARAFAELLANACAVRALPAGANAGASGVLVTHARAMVGRSARALAVVGLNDGGFPAHAADEVLLGEVERRAVLRTSQRLLERTGGREDETLLFLSVVACATEALSLSGARYDVGGRALPPSPFMVDARRATGLHPRPVGRDPLARSREVPPRGPERALRAWMQRAGVVPAALAPAVESARARAAIETERREYFAGLRAGPGRYTGRIDHDARVMRELDIPGYASARRPVAVTTLERAARCGFRAFTLDVLRLEAEEDPALTLDPKQRGHLLHALVEAGQHAHKAARGESLEAQHAAISDALDRAGARFVRDVPNADPDLLRADLLAIRRQVETWLARRTDADARWEMLGTEVEFGPQKPWPAIEVPVDGQPAIVIKGRIDGVERLDDEVRVVEFKSGRGDGFRKRLREGALDTQFQLLVYAAALTRAAQQGATPEARSLDGRYVGFRDQSEHGLREALGPGRGGREAVMDVDEVVTQGARGQGKLAHAVRLAVLPLREGVFAPRPRDCEFCDAASLCRIERQEGSRDE